MSACITSLNGGHLAIRSDVIPGSENHLFYTLINALVLENIADSVYVDSFFKNDTRVYPGIQTLNREFSTNQFSACRQIHSLFVNPTDTYKWTTLVSFYRYDSGHIPILEKMLVRNKSGMLRSKMWNRFFWQLFGNDLVVVEYISGGSETYRFLVSALTAYNKPTGAAMPTSDSSLLADKMVSLFNNMYNKQGGDALRALHRILPADTISADSAGLLEGIRIYNNEQQIVWAIDTACLNYAIKCPPAAQLEQVLRIYKSYYPEICFTEPDIALQHTRCGPNYLNAPVKITYSETSNVGYLIFYPFLISTKSKND